MSPANPTYLEAIWALDEAQIGRERTAEARERLGTLLGSCPEGGLAGLAAKQQAARVSSLLFGDPSLRVVSHEAREDLSPSLVLLRRRGNCLGVTSVYLAITEALGLPARPLLFDGHITVGWAGPRGGVRLVVQLERRGRVRTARASQLHLNYLGRGRFISTDEFLAVHLNNRAAFVAAPRGRLDLAEAFIDEAIRLFPGYLGAWINRAVVLSLLGRDGEAVEVIAHCRSLGPSRRYLKVLAGVDARISGAAGVLGR